MTLEFEFVRPSGRLLSVVLADTDPPKLIYLNDYAGQGDPPTEGFKDKSQQVLSTVKLTPREACQATQQEGRIYAEVPSISLSLFLGYPERPAPSADIASAWQVSYYDRPNITEVRFLVSSQDGRILKRLRNLEELTPTPVDQQIGTQPGGLAGEPR
jgi:hypothetical protein